VSRCRLLGHKADERVYLFLCHRRLGVDGSFFAAGHLQPTPLELLSEVAGLSFTFGVRRLLRRARDRWHQPEPSFPDELVNISGSLAKPPDSEKAPQWQCRRQSRAKAAHGMGNLSREEQQGHLAAQRVRSRSRWLRCGWGTRCPPLGRRRAHIRVASAQIDAAREKFREPAMTAPTMVDYLHLEIVPQSG